MPTAARRLPARPAQIAIIAGFLLGTWMLMDGLHRAITGSFVRWQGWPTGQTGPWPAVVCFGALWMLVPNLLLFQNRRGTWWATVGLTVATGWWYRGTATGVLGAIALLLLLPASRRGLSAR